MRQGVWTGNRRTRGRGAEKRYAEARAKLADALSREPLPGPGVPVAKLKALSPGPQDYAVLKEAALVLDLDDPDAKKRRDALVQLGESSGWDQAPVLEVQAAREKDPKVLREAQAALRLLILRHPDQAPAGRLAQAVAEIYRASVETRQPPALS